MKLRGKPGFPAVLILPLVLDTHPAAAQKTGQPDPRLRLRGIELAVDIDYESERLAGTVALEVENLSANPEKEASLLLGRLMRFERIEAPDGSPIPFRQEIVTFADSPKKQVNRALVEMPVPIAAHGRERFRVAYSGYLVGYTETGSLYIKDHIDPEFTIVRADAYAFPVVAVVSDEKNKSILLADFSFDLRVTVPGDLTVADGGELVERTRKGQRTTWHYRSASPVPFLNVAIAKYDVAEKDGIKLYSFPKDREGAGRVMDSAQRAVGLFRSWFGPTTTPAHFAVIEIPSDCGSQASLAGGIIQTASTFEDPDALVELYHEISHFWNPPDIEPLSPRINEGLAMYLQYRAAQEIDRRGDIDAKMNARARRLIEAGATEPRLSTTPLSEFGKAGMTDWSYSVGQLLFDLLEKIAGPEKFREIVGGFYQQFKETGATTADFVSLARARGGPAVELLLQEWLISTRWLARLRSGETLSAMAKRYASVISVPALPGSS
jgi:hypothetical protein